MQPTNQEIVDMVEKQTEAFHDHAKDDQAFQDETRKTDEVFHQMLTNIANKLDPKHPDYINATLEKKLEPVLEREVAMKYASKFVLGLAAILLAIGAVGGSILWVVSYIRHG